MICESMRVCVVNKRTPIYFVVIVYIVILIIIMIERIFNTQEKEERTFEIKKNLKSEILFFVILLL